jgi:hypothetical protein
MLYTLGHKSRYEYVLYDTQASAGIGDLVWESLRVARTWRDTHKPKMGIFGLLADWDEDTSVVEGEPYRKLTDSFKLVSLRDLFPEWLNRLSSRVAEEAWEAGLMDSGQINPDFITPEEEEKFYNNKRDEVTFRLKAMVSMVMFEELEEQGLLKSNDSRKYG